MSGAMKPMLAADCDGDIAQLRFPLLASPKLDGVRAIIGVDGVVYSRTLKPIPNRFVQEALGSLPDGLDGELIVGDPTHPECYRKTVSVVMSHEKDEAVTFYVFDRQIDGEVVEFSKRLEDLWVLDLPGQVRLVEHVTVDSIGDLAAYEESCLAAGHEGVMVRSLDGAYKHGRATLREGTLTKVKRFKDAEAKIVGVKEMMHNDNEAVTNELGRTSRSTAKAGKRASGVLGAITMIDPASGLEFDCGTGFTAAERKALWAIRGTLGGRYGKYRYFPTGGKERPRHPVWVGFRDPVDMEVAA